MGAVKNMMCVGVICGSYLFNLGVNHLISNYESVKERYHSVSRADGAFGHTSFTRIDVGNSITDDVYQFRLFGPSRTMTDGLPYGDRDGLVDTIHIMDSLFESGRTLYREKDYDRNKKEFDRSDKVLAETKERFKDYFSSPAEK